MTEAMLDSTWITKTLSSLPRKIAAQIVFTGGSLSAQEAYQYGLVNKVVPASQLMEAAQQVAEEILECAPLAVKSSKKYIINLAWDMPLKAVGIVETHTEARESDDAKEGPRAFVEKRQPVWKGR